MLSTSTTPQHRNTPNNYCSYVLAPLPVFVAFSLSLSLSLRSFRRFFLFLSPERLNQRKFFSNLSTKSNQLDSIRFDSIELTQFHSISRPETTRYHRGWTHETESITFIHFTTMDWGVRVEICLFFGSARFGVLKAKAKEAIQFNSNAETTRPTQVWIHQPIDPSKSRGDDHIERCAVALSCPRRVSTRFELS